MGKGPIKMDSGMSDVGGGGGDGQLFHSEVLFLFRQYLENRALSPVLEMRWQWAWPLLPLLACDTLPSGYH